MCFRKQIIDWLALVGDASDNIPGVPKVGAKTAAKWLNQYESADGIVANSEDIKGKVGESLREKPRSAQVVAETGDHPSGRRSALETEGTKTERTRYRYAKDTLQQTGVKNDC